MDFVDRDDLARREATAKVPERGLEPLRPKALPWHHSRTELLAPSPTVGLWAADPTVSVGGGLSRQALVLLGGVHPDQAQRLGAAVRQHPQGVTIGYRLQPPAPRPPGPPGPSRAAPLL